MHFHPGSVSLLPYSFFLFYKTNIKDIFLASEMHQDTFFSSI